MQELDGGASGPGKIRLTEETMQEFLDLFYRTNERVELTNPRRTLTRLLANATWIADGICRSDLFCFSIEAAKLKRVIVRPTLTRHARERMEQRFGIRAEETDTEAVRDILEARDLHKRDLRPLRIYEGRKTRKHIKVVGRADRIYILRDHRRVITVLRADAVDADAAADAHAFSDI